MSLVQRFFLAILPRKWGQFLESESRRWNVRCPCGCERSVWELGGIRWKAAGKEYCYIRCPQCGKSNWHTLRKKPPTDPPRIFS